MPIHDWTKVDAGLFHAFHHDLDHEPLRALNLGVLPAEYFALPEQSIGAAIPDVLTLELTAGTEEANGAAGLAVATAPPRTRLVRQTEDAVYTSKASRVAIRHRHGQIVSVVEIVSPGNKSSRTALRQFVEKSADLIGEGIHLLVVDLFPPTKRDPQGMYKAIWDEFVDEDFELPAGKPLSLASYDAGPPQTVYGEFIAVGDTLPEMPIFLRPGYYVPAPLEASYEATWSFFPAPMKKLLEMPTGQSGTV